MTKIKNEESHIEQQTIEGVALKSYLHSCRIAASKNPQKFFFYSAEIGEGKALTIEKATRIQYISFPSKPDFLFKIQISCNDCIAKNGRCAITDYVAIVNKCFNITWGYIT